MDILKGNTKGIHVGACVCMTVSSAGDLRFTFPCTGQYPLMSQCGHHHMETDIQHCLCSLTVKLNDENGVFLGVGRQAQSWCLRGHVVRARGRHYLHGLLKGPQAFLKRLLHMLLNK